MKRLITLALILIAVIASAQETVTIGTQVWMKRNVNIGTMIPNTQPQLNNGIIEKWCYNNNPIKCDKFGGWYQWGEVMQYVTTEGAKGLCPDGFHIPTYAEWMTLLDFCGGTQQAGKILNGDLWAQSSWTSEDPYGFTMQANGIVTQTKTGSLVLFASYNWTSSKKTYAELPYYKDYYSGISGQNNVIFSGQNWDPKIEAVVPGSTWGVALRCIHD